MSKNNSIASRIDIPPDVASSSNDYANRFAGNLGEYFLEIQKKYSLDLLNKSFGSEKFKPGKVLEIGGGHCQLTQTYLDLGFEVTIQGSDERSLLRARELGFDKNPKVKFLICPLDSINAKDSEYEIVSAIRLMAHVNDWQKFLSEISRVSKNIILIDFANLYSINIFSPILFRIKKLIEKTTRPYNCQTKKDITRELLKLEFTEIFFKSQFILPMGLHRLLNNVESTKKLEKYFSKYSSDSIGSPVICVARKDL